MSTKKLDTEKYMEPARSVIEKLGGVQVSAKILRRHPSNVYRWLWPESRGGTGGKIPHDVATEILIHARENGLEVSAEDFFALPGGGNA